MGINGRIKTLFKQVTKVKSFYNIPPTRTETSQSKLRLKNLFKVAELLLKILIPLYFI